MKLEQLRQLLVTHLGSGNFQSRGVGQEVVEQLINGEEVLDVPAVQVTVFQINGTTVLLSNDHLARPKSLIFVNLSNGKSFLRRVEI